VFSVKQSPVKRWQNFFKSFCFLVAAGPSEKVKDGFLQAKSSKAMKSSAAVQFPPAKGLSCFALCSSSNLERSTLQRCFFDLHLDMYQIQTNSGSMRACCTVRQISLKDSRQSSGLVSMKTCDLFTYFCILVLSGWHNQPKGHKDG
jgi:hypothetical protein